MAAKRTVLGILLVILFAVSLVFSLDYIAVNAEHECSGEQCKICAVLQTAEEVAGGAKKAAAVAAAAAALFAVCLVIRSENTSEQADTTPVSRCDVLTN